MLPLLVTQLGLAAANNWPLPQQSGNTLGLLLAPGDATGGGAPALPSPLVPLHSCLWLWQCLSSCLWQCERPRNACLDRKVPGSATVLFLCRCLSLRSHRADGAVFAAFPRSLTTMLTPRCCDRSRRPPRPRCAPAGGQSSGAWIGDRSAQHGLQQGQPFFRDSGERTPWHRQIRRLCLRFHCSCSVAMARAAPEKRRAVLNSTPNHRSARCGGTTIAPGETVILPPSTFSRCINSDGERASAK